MAYIDLTMFSGTAIVKVTFCPMVSRLRSHLGCLGKTETCGAC